MTSATTALILEDEAIIGFVLEDMLLELGFDQVELTTTMESARQYLEDRAPDVAILDVNIHGQRSYALTDELISRQIPFIFATGYGDAEHPGELKHVTTLTKPYSLDDLRHALDSALRPSG
jgi:CheY-like chemotaxis protein